VAGGVAVGAYKDYGAARQYNKIVSRIEPYSANAGRYRDLYDAFKLAYEQLTPVYERLARVRAGE